MGRDARALAVPKLLPERSDWGAGPVLHVRGPMKVGDAFLHPGYGFGCITGDLLGGMFRVAFHEPGRRPFAGVMPEETALDLQALLRKSAEELVVCSGSCVEGGAA
jgi:hypothetical protein